MSEEWVERSRYHAGGQIETWRERPKPGCPGVVERVAIDPVTRYAATMAGVPGADYEVIPPSLPVARHEQVGTGPWEIVMSGEAARQLGALDLREDLELAGAVWGRRDGYRFEITGLSENCFERERYACKIDVEAIDEAAKHRSDDLIGVHHSHPSAGLPKASLADLRVFKAWQRSIDGPAVFLITSPTKVPLYGTQASYTEPLILAHVVDRGEDGELTSELAIVDFKPWQI
jgi:proteasome lid subunit RPN8/RPN11